MRKKVTEEKEPTAVLLERLLFDAEEEEEYRRTEPYLLARYFKTKLKVAGYTISNIDWEKTKKAANKINRDYSHIPMIKWKECIDWVFSPERYKDPFWAQVVISNLGTVIKIYNTFKNLEKSKSGKRAKKTVNYGRRKDG